MFCDEGQQSLQERRLISETNQDRETLQVEKLKRDELPQMANLEVRSKFEHDLISAVQLHC